MDRANRRLSDEDPLVYAAGAGRVLVTYNQADYQVLDATWACKGESTTAPRGVAQHHLA